MGFAALYPSCICRPHSRATNILVRRVAPESYTLPALRRQRGGVMAQVIFDEALDEPIAVVVAGISAQLQRLAGGGARRFEQLRSEEHTSELQSLMRISYAVFCLKKKKH